MAELLSRPDLIALVDRLILEQGRYSGLQLLLAAGWLRQADVDDLLADRPPALLQRIRLPPLATSGQATDAAVTAAALAAFCQQAAGHARAQGLVADESPVPLTATGIGLPGPPGERLALALGTVFRPAADRRQPDLFQDSTVTLLETYLCAAVTRQRSRAARAALARLGAHEPDRARLARWQQLVAAAEGLRVGRLPQSPTAAEDPAPVAAEEPGPVSLPTATAVGPVSPPEPAWAAVEAVSVTARELLGRDAARLMQPLWTLLAQSLAGQPFDPAAPNRHSAAAWEQAGCWSEARWAVEATPDWHTDPWLVAWHARLCWQAGDATAARRDWLALCWSAPAQAIRVLDAADLPDTALGLAWQCFGDLDEPLPTTSFPAWLLVAEPAIAAALGDVLVDDQPPASPVGGAFKRLRALVGGDDGLAQRQALAALDPALLRVWLRARAG